MDFRQLQSEQAKWQEYNFPQNTVHSCMYGVTEEVGELAHSLLKMDQGIRGTKEQHEAKAKDAVGDIVIYLAGLCTKRGFDFQECVEMAWGEASKRDWIKYPLNGVSQ